MLIPKDALVRIQEGRQSLILRSGPKCMYAVGKPYKVKSHRDHEARLTITITEKREVTHEELGLREARRLGFRTTAELYATIPHSVQIWLLSFETGDVSDTPRLLAKRPGPGHDYVSSTAQAMNSSAEEVSEHLQAKYSTESAEGLRIARTAQYEASRARLLDVIAEIRSFAGDSIRANDKLRGIERQVRALDKAL